MIEWVGKILYAALMIKTVAALVEALMEREVEVLQQYKLEHGPMIGDMYEGLTHEVLNKSIFESLDLRVVGGKIRNGQGVLSRQIDCMIVEGECESIPYTSHFLCDVKNVIAIVEVKKSLYSAQLRDSLGLLADIKARVYEPNAMKVNLVRDAWVALTLSELPTHDEIGSFGGFEQAMFHSLMVAANLPLRVVLGYGGFSTEHGMRKGFAELLEKEMESSEGPIPLGPLALPNQIICGNHCILKLDGMPYSAPLEGATWPLLASSPGSSLEIFLELLWTRLAYRYSLSSTIFGEDLVIDQFNLLIDASAVTDASGGVVGWGYDYRVLSESALAQPLEHARWEPETLTKAEFVVVQELCEKEVLSTSEEGLADFLKREGTSIDELARSLRLKRLAYERSGELRLLTKECQCAILADGRYVAGENNSGRFTRWFKQYSAAPETDADAVS